VADPFGKYMDQQSIARLHQRTAQQVSFINNNKRNQLNTIGMMEKDEEIHNKKKG
jgi:hypothetical protein